MSDQQKSALFAAWLDGNMSDEQQQQFERLCIEDEGFSQRVEQANQLNLISENFAEANVPSWDMHATFDAPEKLRWWQSPAWGVSSMACSVFAVLLVVSGFNMSVQDGRLSMGFSSGLSVEQVNVMVEQRLTDYQATNQAMFAQYVDAITTQQQQSSAQLTEYLLSSSRQERREDFAELIKFINEQRSDDQIYYAKQLNNLQKEIYAQGGIRTAIPTMSTGESPMPNE